MGFETAVHPSERLISGLFNQHPLWGLKPCYTRAMFTVRVFNQHPLWGLKLAISYSLDFIFSFNQHPLWGLKRLCITFRA